MNEQQALDKMYSPGMHRHGKKSPGGVMQIWVTSNCDRACYGCTQGSNLKMPFRYISVEHFEKACKSLRNPNYFGTVGVFGGNPCIHPQFPELCAVMREHIPFRQRGLWSNKFFGRGKVCRETFNPSVSNLNVHMDQDAYDEMKRDWPECHPVGLKGDSRHSPPYVAMKDLVPEDSKRWDLIADCDINRYWSAMICVVGGKLVGYFCEIAGAQAILHQEDPSYPNLGVEVKPGWWQKSMNDFKEQVRLHCHSCGVPLRGRGELACSSEGVEQVTKIHAGIYHPKPKSRSVSIVSSLEELGSSVTKMTDYLGNARR